MIMAALRGLLENGVDTARAGRYVEHVPEEFDGVAKRNMPDHREQKYHLIRAIER
jgi:hypothetical protein